MIFRKKDTAPKPKKTLKAVVWEWTETLGSALIMALVIRALFIQAYKIPTGSMEPTLLGAEMSRNHGRRIGDHLLVEKITYGILLPFTQIRLPRIRDIRRGDVVVFKYPYEPGKDYIKRIIGLPGDKFQIINKKVYINDKPLEEPWLKFGERHFDSGMIIPEEANARDNIGPLLIPKKGDIIRLDGNKIYINNNYIYNKKVVVSYSQDEYFRTLYTRINDARHSSLTRLGPNKYRVEYDCYMAMGDNRDNSSDSRYWGFLPYNYITGKPLVIYWPPTRLNIVR